MSSQPIGDIVSARTDVPIITGATKVVGVFGHPVEHSRSPAMHNAAFAALLLPFIYVPFSVEPNFLSNALGSLGSLGIIGVNLTIPHKEAALHYLDAVTPEALEIGAVNTVHVVEGRLVGDNTDSYGFFAPLQDVDFQASGAKVVVFGAGGAARAVVFRLAREGCHVTLVNRTTERAIRLAESVHSSGYHTVEVVAVEDSKLLNQRMANCQLVVNSSRVGMYPAVDQSPNIPLELLPPDSIVYDLVYNPVETQLLKLARLLGLRTVNGVKMLVYQGAASFERWTGLRPPLDVMERSVLAGLE